MSLADLKKEVDKMKSELDAKSKVYYEKKKELQQRCDHPRAWRGVIRDEDDYGKLMDYGQWHCTLCGHYESFDDWRTVV